MGKVCSLQCEKCYPTVYLSYWEELMEIDTNEHSQAPIFSLKIQRVKRNRPNQTVFSVFNKTLPFTLRKGTSIHFHKFLFNSFFLLFLLLFFICFFSPSLFFSLPSARGVVKENRDKPDAFQCFDQFLCRQPGCLLAPL